MCCRTGEVKKYGSAFSIPYKYMFLPYHMVLLWVLYFFEMGQDKPDRFSFFFINHIGVTIFYAYFSSFIGYIFSIITIDLIFKIVKKDFRFRLSPSEKVLLKELTSSKLFKASIYISIGGLIFLILLFLFFKYVVGL